MSIQRFSSEINSEFFKGDVTKVVRVLAVLAAGAMSLLLISSCVTRVGPGYVGIKVSMAGSNRGVEDTPATTGWVFYNPLISKVYEYPTFVQTAKWTKDLNEGKPINEEITFTNRDSMLIAADISLSYTLRPDKVPHFYVKFRNDKLEDFTHGFLRNVARDMFNETAGKYSIEQIMGDNGPFLAEVREKLQKQVEPIGVVIEQFGFIGAPRPPEAITHSINAKVQAQQIAQQKQNEITQAEAEARKAIVAAEGEAKAAVARANGEAAASVARAEGEAKANRTLAASISQQVIDWRKLQIQSQTIEKWNGQRPQVEGNGSGLLFTLPAK